jgi:hypothetical protein
MQPRQGGWACRGRRVLVNAVSVALRKGPSESPSCTTPRPMSPPTTVPSVRSTDTCGAEQGASLHGCADAGADTECADTNDHVV